MYSVISKVRISLIWAEQSGLLLLPKRARHRGEIRAPQFSHLLLDYPELQAVNLGYDYLLPWLNLASL